MACMCSWPSACPPWLALGVPLAGDGATGSSRWSSRAGLVALVVGVVRGIGTGGSRRWRSPGGRGRRG
ncbi:hypothetical protein QJS66_13980 [Kocuria rhizophila]|nr:hypothetical protein QJS66_13980 [Kocuria rhizophila]